MIESDTWAFKAGVVARYVGLFWLAKWAITDLVKRAINKTIGFEIREIYRIICDLQERD